MGVGVLTPYSVKHMHVSYSWLSVCDFSISAVPPYPQFYIFSSVGSTNFTLCGTIVFTVEKKSVYKRFCTVLSLNIYREAGRERGGKRLIYCEELAYINCGG